MRDVVVVGAVRTAIGRFGGSLMEFTAPELGGLVGAEAVRRAGLSGEDVDEVIVSNARQAGVGPNPGRQVVARAGLPLSIPGHTVNMACGSGIKAIETATTAIWTGQADTVLVVGTELMSRIPYLLDRARWGYRMGSAELLDAMHKDGFICALANMHMGLTAENLAEKYGITRRESDEYAITSQQKAGRAIKEGRFASQILPVAVPQKKGESLSFATDEHPRPDTTPEALAKLPPAFKKDGQVTAGSASGGTDGAAAVVVMAEDKARARGLKPLLRIKGLAGAGVDPHYMGIGPVPATRKVLDKTKMTLDDVDVIEVNEAFAAQVLACERELKWDWEKVNPNGGAIALGHPIGMTGVRLVVALAYELERQDKELGLATLCINGGMGMACLVERCG
ncbi:MAG: acetyl-CoA C-acetyltransferase [Actinobacteria bacterium]|nr:acetyl-CoA C-acetyltransferase [Actinomycetota bacterium]